MDAIKELLELDFTGLILCIFIFIIGINTSVKLIGDFSKIIGHPVKWVKNKEKDHQLLIQTIKNLSNLHNKHEEDTQNSIKHDEMIRKDLHSLTITVNNIADKIEILEEKIDATEMAKLKEKILGYYRKYKDIGEWQRFESDVFWGLYDRYISHGGNSFVIHDIEPIMRNLKIKD